MELGAPAAFARIVWLGTIHLDLTETIGGRNHVSNIITKLQAAEPGRAELSSPLGDKELECHHR